MKRLTLCLLCVLSLDVSFAQEAQGQANKESTAANPTVKKIDKVQSTDKTQQKQEAARPTLTATVIEPHYRQIFQTIKATGNIEAREIAYVSAQTAGLSLSKLYVDVGDVIKKGALLAEYDAATVYNDIAQAQAALAQANVAYAQAKANAKRGQRLRKSTAISSMEADNFLYQEKQARASVRSAKAVLENQKLRASYAKVRAKFSGLVMEKFGVLGEVGNPGTRLYSVIVNNTLEWQANVPSELLNKIHRNMPVEVTLTESTNNNTNGNTMSKVAGVVRKIDPTINSQTRQGKVYVTMKPNPNLRRGLFVTGAFITGAKDLLVIPVDCLMRKDGYNYVFVIGKDNRVKRKKVKVGQLQYKGISILEGLTSSERVVSSGVGFLNDGDLVKVVKEL